MWVFALALVAIGAIGVPAAGANGRCVVAENTPPGGTTTVCEPL
jgi:hypothetical protein